LPHGTLQAPTSWRATDRNRNPKKLPANPKSFETPSTTPGKLENKRVLHEIHKNAHLETGLAGNSCEYSHAMCPRDQTIPSKVFTRQISRTVTTLKTNIIYVTYRVEGHNYNEFVDNVGSRCSDGLEWIFLSPSTRCEALRHWQ
jgi:hypothetical protein